MPNIAIEKASPNYNERSAKAVIDTIIIHYTGMPSLDAALERLCDNSREAEARGRVSAHYVVDEDGTIYALVDEYDRAWHAGVSFWRDRKDVNDYSIGIELVNRGHEFGYQDFSRQQMDALVKLCQGIMKRHPIKQANVLGHSDVAPTRKIDPGEKFDWQFLARKGIGLWPDTDEEDNVRSQMYFSSQAVLRGALIRYGYDPEADIESMCRAFNLHYGRSDSKVLTVRAATMLSWLNRKALK